VSTVTKHTHLCIVPILYNGLANVPLKSASSRGECGPSSITKVPGLNRSLPRMASQCVQPFCTCDSSLWCPTQRHTRTTLRATRVGKGVQAVRVKHCRASSPIHTTDHERAARHELSLAAACAFITFARSGTSALCHALFTDRCRMLISAGWTRPPVTRRDDLYQFALRGDCVTFRIPSLVSKTTTRIRDEGG